ncbi:MAG: hypothetical protein U9N49_08350 [Campylobacterota bacterium]|nr:hypothetical protein [Campylobacterota bacterium]
MQNSTKPTKTNEDRIKSIYDLAKEHFGEVRFVGIKLHDKIGWVAKIQFDEFESLIAEGSDATEALKNLKKRVKKIVHRYNLV